MLLCTFMVHPSPEHYGQIWHLFKKGLVELSKGSENHQSYVQSY